VAEKRELKRKKKKETKRLFFVSIQFQKDVIRNYFIVYGIQNSQQKKRARKKS